METISGPQKTESSSYNLNKEQLLQYFSAVFHRNRIKLRRCGSSLSVGSLSESQRRKSFLTEGRRSVCSLETVAGAFAAMATDASSSSCLSCLFPAAHLYPGVSVICVH